MACVVDIRHVSKYFAKVAANKDVSLTVDAGQVVALLGENGAGKSTIMKILYGLYTKDEGEILIDGVPQQIHSPKDAMACGIAMIQQHAMRKSRRWPGNTALTSRSTYPWGSWPSACSKRSRSSRRCI